MENVTVQDASVRGGVCLKTATATGHLVTSVQVFQASCDKSDARMSEAQKTLNETRRSLQETMARLNAREETTRNLANASDDIERRWSEFKSKFDEKIKNIVDKIGKELLLENEEGQKERWDAPAELRRRAIRLADAIRAADGGVVVFTGAGISTSAGAYGSTSQTGAVPVHRQPRRRCMAAGQTIQH